MRALINIIQETAESYFDYYDPDDEEKYWIFPDGSEDGVDNHDMWAEDNFSSWAGTQEEDDAEGYMHDSSSCLDAGFIRLNISHFEDVGVEVNVDFTDAATKRARSSAATTIKDYKDIATQFVIGNTVFTDWRKAMRAMMA